MREIKLRVKILRALASRSRGALPLVGGVCWGITAGKASHNASNARDVTAGKVGRNSSNRNTHIVDVFGSGIRWFTRSPGASRIPFDDSNIDHSIVSRCVYQCKTLADDF